MTKITSPHEIVNVMHDKLKDSKWDSIMKTYIQSEDFRAIFEFITQEINDGNRITPLLKDLMEPFTHCLYPDLKVVFIADAPYNAINLANGLAFSYPVSKSKELALKVLHNKIADEVYNNKNTVSSFTTDLRVWAEQGILLLNSSFTTVFNKKCTHFDKWKPFISHLLDMLNSKHKNIIYVFFGKNAQYFSELINSEENLVIELEFPGDQGYRWDSKNMFNKINEYLQENNKETIVW